MADQIRFFELNTGARIPCVGLGTWRAEPGVVAHAIATAIKVNLFLAALNSVLKFAFFF